MPLLFHDKGTRRDQKRLARVSSPVNVPRLPCRLVPPCSCSRRLYLSLLTIAPPSMRPPESVQNCRRSPERKRVCQRNEPTAVVVLPCLPLFSESVDAHAAALP